MNREKKVSRVRGTEQRHNKREKIVKSEQIESQRKGKTYRKYSQKMQEFCSEYKSEDYSEKKTSFGPEEKLKSYILIRPCQAMCHNTTTQTQITDYTLVIVF